MPAPMTDSAPQLPWIERPTIDVDLSRPANQRLADVPVDAIAESRNLLAAVQKEIPSSMRAVADLVRVRTANRFHAEAAAFADIAQVSWRDVLLANLVYDFTISMFGCSTMALASPDGPVLARNMDFWPENILARASWQIRYHRAGELAFANLGWPGAIGIVTGLSGRGFALAINAVFSHEGVNRAGYPVLLHLRRVLEDATDFDDALRMLAETKLAAAALITLVGQRNDQRVVVERSPTRVALRRAEGDRPLFATNDYRLLTRPQTHQGLEIYQTTCDRYEALSEFLAAFDASRPVEDSMLLYLLTDPRVLSGITAQHTIIRPRQRIAKLFVPRRVLM